MDIVTERLKLKDIFPKKAKEFAKRYKFKSEDDIQLIRKGLTPADLKVSEEENSIISYITTATVDRDNEIVDPKGAILGDYNKNKVVLWGHDYHSRNLPLGRNQWLKMDDKGIIAKTEYYIKDEFANKVYNYRKDGFPLAESIGFIPLEWDDFENEKDIKANDGAKRKYNKWLLLEYSDVPVPSNPDAVEMAMKKGLVTEEEAKDLIEVEIDEIELSESQEKEQKDVEKIEINQIKDDKKIPESEEKEVIHKPEETEDYIHIPVIDASKFVKDSFRTIDIDKKKGIKAVIGKLKTDPQGSTKVQKFIFDKKPPYNWTMARAQAWIKEHKKEVSDYIEKMEGIDLVELLDEELDISGIFEEIEEDFDKELDNVIVKFHGSPRNPFGSHCSFRFKGGATGYKKAWTLHCSQINGGALTPAASGPLRGTVRRIAMISAGMKPPCKVVESEGIGARGGAKSPLPGTYPEKPSDYGLSSWLKPGDEGVDAKKATQFTCSDLNTIKRILVMEIKRRIKDREAQEGKGMSDEEKEYFPEEKEKDKSFSFNEIYEIVKQNKELMDKLENISVELKAGAVLNKKNKSDLNNAQQLIQNVLDSAETAEPAEEGKEVFNCECIECGYKMKSDKHCKDIKCPKCGGTMRRAERPGPGQRNVDDVIEIPDKEIVNIELPDKDKKEENSQVMVEIDEKRITDIVNNVFEKHIKADTSISDVKKEITNSIKRAKGKVF